MIAFTKVDDLEKILRQTLITQSELNPDRVLNSLSLYGTELDKLLSENVYVSIEQPDTTMLFELKSRKSDADISFTSEEDNDDMSITYDKAFTLRVIMYGYSSSDIALKLTARLRTEEIRLQLYEQGVYLEKVSDPYIINEYKNETMWLRNDIEIDIAAKFDILPIHVDHDFASLSEINIIKNKEEQNV